MFPSVSGLVAAGRPHLPLREPRVFVTGVTSGSPMHLVSRLVEAGCAVLVQQMDPDQAIDAELRRLVADGGLVAAHVGDFDTITEAMRMTANAAKAQGSLDLVVNFITVETEALGEALNAASGDGVEDVIALPIEAALAGTSVAANRMGLTWRSGLVVNVLSMTGAEAPTRHLLASIMRSAFANCTRQAAQHWAGQGVRINAICSGDARLPECEALVSLIMHLKGGDAADLSGCVFDPDLVGAAS